MTTERPRCEDYWTHICEMFTALGTQPRVTVGDWEAVSERLALSACPTYIAVSELVTHRVALRVSAVLLLRVWNPVRDCVNGRSGVGGESADHNCVAAPT